MDITSIDLKIMEISKIMDVTVTGLDKKRILNVLADLFKNQL